MNEEHDLKKMYPLHMRIGLLITLVIFLLGFMFIPETEVSEYKPQVTKSIEVQKLPPQLKNIAKPPPPPKPKMPVAAESDEEAEAETIEKTDFTGYEENKEADVELNVPDFVPYDTPPKPINLSQLQARTPYPEAAKKLGIEGTVYLELVIDKEGDVREVTVTRSLYPILDKIAVKMARQLKFTPAMQRDMPVAVRISFPYNFQLEED